MPSKYLHTCHSVAEQCMPKYEGSELKIITANFSIKIFALHPTPTHANSLSVFQNCLAISQFANKSPGEGKKRVNKTSFLTAIKVRAPGGCREIFPRARSSGCKTPRELPSRLKRAGLLFEIRRWEAQQPSLDGADKGPEKSLQLITCSVSFIAPLLIGVFIGKAAVTRYYLAHPASN